MYLRLFKNMTKCVEFNSDLKSFGEELYLEDRKTCGFGYRGVDCEFAVYARSETIVFFALNDVWDMLSPDTFVDYFHVYDRKCTYFKVSNGQQKFEIAYPSWWVDRVDCPQFEGDLLVEDDLVEDFFGYVAAIKNNRKMACNLYDLWIENVD